MLVAIHQPHYLPWLGYIEKAQRADLFIFLDTVAFSRGGWQNRNYVRGRSGRQLLSVPVRHSGAPKPLGETWIADEHDWRRKHCETLLQAYAGTAGAAELAPMLPPFYRRAWTSLAELGIDSSRQLFELFGVTTECVRASELGPTLGRKTALLVELCQRVGATSYLTGDGSRYLDEELFAAAGLKVVWQGFRHPIYSQQGGEFVSNLSGLDMLFHLGPARASRALFRSSAEAMT